MPGMCRQSPAEASLIRRTVTVRHLRGLVENGNLPFLWNPVTWRSFEVYACQGVMAFLDRHVAETDQNCVQCVTKLLIYDCF